MVIWTAKPGGQMFNTKSMLTRMTLDSLMQDHKRAFEDEASISLVTDASECVDAEEPQEAQHAIACRSWRSSGIYVN
jgi:hypothetical protein